MIALRDKIKDDAKEAIKKLEEMGIETAMLTGDSKTTAESIAKEIGIKKVFSEVSPKDKVAYIAKLKL